MNLIDRDFSDTLQILSDFKDCRYLVAFSGGSDSLALLTLCVRTLGKNRTVAVYVNHNLRTQEELSKEIQINVQNCKKLGVDLIIREIEDGLICKSSKGVGIEAAARKLRYKILEEERVSNRCDYILTAHHRDDQIETVLMKMMSNSSIPGLRGISEKRKTLIRPLLEFSKEDLRKYIFENNLISSEDSTNKLNDFSRNEIRNEIIPQLKVLMPDYEKRILNIRNYAVGQCREIEEVYDCIDIEKFNSYNEAQKTLVLYSMWDNIIGSSMPQTLVKRVVQNPEKKTSANGGLFYSEKGYLYLINLADDIICHDFNEDFDFLCEKTLLPLGLEIIRKTDGEPTELCFDKSQFKGKVFVRFPKLGERIVLKDGSKTINKLLQDMKIPDVLRLRVPVLADDDGICAVFASVYGGRDRICVKLRSSLAHNNYYKYICYKGNNVYEKN